MDIGSPADQGAAQQNKFKTSEYCVKNTSNINLHHYHIFVDFKRAFDRVWHAAPRATKRLHSIDENVIRVIQHLDDNVNSAVYFNNNTGDC